MMAILVHAVMTMTFMMARTVSPSMMGRTITTRRTTLQRPPGEVVGIDLGTTSSAVAVILGGEPEVVPDADGRMTIPSRVEFDGDGAAAVGHAAPSATALCSTKRIIGRSYAHAQGSAAMRSLFGSSLRPLPDGSAGLDTRSPEDAAAALLSALLAHSEAMCGVRASKAVVTVPAHFTEPQREATKRAAERAGLAKVRLLEEPVAAALAYGVGVEDTDELVMVFDLGGGTLDVSLLRVGRGVSTRLRLRARAA